MKILPYIIGFILLANIFACQRETTYPLAMQQAESLMNTHPDSALYLLQNMADDVSTLPEEAQMYYHLLTIQAKDKQYITHTSDSLINSIVEFYEDYDNNDRLMLAYYYQGRVFRDMNDAPRALKAFQQAEKFKFINSELLTKVYSQMGYLFSYQGLYDEAIRVNKACVNIYRNLKQENKEYFALRDIARAYEAKEMEDSALHYYKECYNIVSENKDSVKLQNILSDLGRLYYNIGKTEKAKDILLNLKRNSTLSDKSHIDLTLGYIYKEQNLWDSAYFHFQQVLLSDNKHKQYYSHKSLFSIEYIRGNHSLASQYAKEALAVKEEIDKVMQTEDITKINSLYNYQHTEEENLQLKLTEEHNNNIILALLSIVSIFVVLFLLLLIRHQSMKRQYQMNKLKLERLQAEEQTPTAIYENQQKIEKLELSLNKETKEEVIPKRQMAYLQLQHLKLRNQEIQLSIEQQKLAIQTLKSTEIYKLFRRASVGEDTKTNDKHWQELQMELKKVYPNFVLHLKELYPKISNVEIRICLLSKFKMPQAHIANVLGYTRGGVSLACERLHKKIFGTKCSAKEFAHFIENI